MSKDDSILSSVSVPGGSGGTPAHLVKVLANVVETQKSVASQFTALFDRVEEARNETRRNVAALAEEIKKLEIRSNTMFEKVTTQLMAQNEALSAAHAAERSQLIAQNENILNLLKATVCNVNRPVTVATQPMQAYNQAMSANAMFGGISNQDQQLIDQFNQLTPNQVGAFQAQMRQLQQYQLQQQAMLASRAAASSTNIVPPSQTPSVPAASIPTIPTPAIPAPVVATQPVVPKVEVKPPMPTPPSTVVTAKPLFSFSSSAGTTPAATKPPFSTSTAPSVATPAAPFPAPSPFTAPKPVIKPVEVKEEPADDENDEDHVEEYEPDVQFTPVIPLPDMVETVTGEEAEKVLLEDRCKLFRYTNGEWKERATGNLKVLKNEKTGKHRVVVRRDQVHKVAANFNLVHGVKIAPMKMNQKAVVWFCVDFSEDEVTGVNEQLSAKFASPQQAEEFMNLVNSIVEGLPKSASTPKKVEESKPVGAKVEIPKAEEPKKSAVVAPVAAPVSTAWGDKFKMNAGEWECTACYVRNKADDVECSCCGTANPNCEKKEDAKPANPFGKNATIFKPATTASPGGAPMFSFGLGGGSTSTAPTSTTVAETKTETKTVTPSASTFSFGSSNSSTPTPTPTAAPATTAAPKFSFMQAAAAATKEDEKKPLFGSSAPPTASSNAFGAGITPTASASSFSFKSAAAPTAVASPLPSFSFKTPDPSKPSSIFGGSQKTLFGTSNPATPVDTKKVEEEKKETPGTVFGSSFMSGAQSTTAGFSGLSGKPSIFDQQDKVAEGQKNFANLAKSKPFGQSAAVAAAAAAPKEDDGEEGDPEEYEPDVQFAPVVPLPDLVEVKTGEEDEKVFFTARCKIFRFIRESKEYKERGVGDLKLLHNEASNKFRVVMRRDQVHKLCANFSVLSSSKLMEKPGQANVRSIVVTDFAENDAGDVESLCIKFKNPEIAQDFQKAFEDAQAIIQ